jgi:hypothetical protein
MILIGGILFAFGMTLLAIGLALSLLRFVILVIGWCVCAVVFVASGSAWLVVKLVQRFMPRQVDAEPSIVINIYFGNIDADDATPTVELPRGSFRRLRG